MGYDIKKEIIDMVNLICVFMDRYNLNRYVRSPGGKGYHLKRTCTKKKSGILGRVTHWLDDRRNHRLCEEKKKFY